MCKKLLALSLAGVLTMSLLSGCSGSGNSTTGSSVGSSAGSSTSGSSQKITLNVADAEAYGLDGYTTMVKAFEQANPNVTVNVQHSANNYDTILQSRVNSGDIPDVFAAEPGSAAENYYEYAYDWTNDTDITSLFSASTLKLSTDSSGKIMALPWDYENMGLIYNKDSFSKAGITTLPNTIDELATDCTALQKAGVTPFALDAKDTWALSQLATHFMMDKSKDAQGTLDAIENGTLKFADMPHWANFFKFLDLVKKYDMPKPLEIDWQSGENDVANGKAAMIHMGDWASANFQSDNPNVKLAFLPIPVGSSAADSTLLSSVGWVFMVNKNSKNLDMAKKYTEFMLTSTPGLTWITQSVEAVPCAKSTLMPSADLSKDAATYINAGKTNGWIYTIAPSDFGDTCGAYIQAYMQGSATASKITQEFQTYFDNVKKPS